LNICDWEDTLAVEIHQRNKSQPRKNTKDSGRCKEGKYRERKKSIWRFIDSSSTLLTDVKAF
jgi:hypothetical protein